MVSFIMKENSSESSKVRNRLIGILLMPPDLAYALMVKLFMAYVADELNHTVTATAITYNVKEMSEILLNIGQSLSISNSVNTNETKRFLESLGSKVDMAQLTEELVNIANEKMSGPSRMVLP